MNNDLISREALKEVLINEYEAKEHYIGKIMLKAIDHAPTVSFMISPDYVNELQNLNKELVRQLGETERPQGEWITKGQDIYCSICNQESAYNEFGASKFSKFCPNCGASMQKGGAE